MDGAHRPLDAVDQRLAEALVEAPRATIRTLAGVVGLSHSATRVRVNELIGSKVVDVVTLVHPATRDQSMIFYATITLCGETPDPQETAALNDASWIWRYHDTPQLHAQMSARDTDDVRAVLQQVMALPWVDSVSVMIALKIHSTGSASRRFGSPADRWDTPAVTSLDSADRAITRYLRSNGRASYTELARAIGLSLTAARRRVLALESENVIRFVTFVDIPDAVHAVLYLDVASNHREQLLAATTVIDGMVMVTELVGAHDVGCTIVAPHEQALTAIVDEVASIPGVTGHELHRFTTLRRTPTRRAGTDTQRSSR